MFFLSIGAGVLLLLYTVEFSKENKFKNLKKCSFDAVVLQTSAEKPTRLYFARAVLLFCSIAILFGDVAQDVALTNSLL